MDKYQSKESHKMSNNQVDTTIVIDPKVEQKQNGHSNIKSPDITVQLFSQIEQLGKNIERNQMRLKDAITTGEKDAIVFRVAQMTSNYKILWRKYEKALKEKGEAEIKEGAIEMEDPQSIPLSKIGYEYSYAAHGPGYTDEQIREMEMLIPNIHSAVILRDI